MKHKTHNIERKILFSLLLTAVIVLVPLLAGAQTTTEESAQGVVLLEGSLPLEGIEGGVVEEGQLGDYLNGLFLLGIGVASGLAVIYITIGGIQYMATANPGKKEGGREKIVAAVGGLILALAAFLILQTINPDLLQFNITSAIDDIVERIKETRKPPLVEPGDPWPSDEAQRTALEQVTNGKVRPNKQNCENVGESGCTSLAGIHPRFYSSVTGIVDRSGCTFTINAGTEYWLHGNRSQEIKSNPTKHKPGNAVIDIDDGLCINQYIMGGTLENPGPSAYSLGCPAEGFARVERDGITYQWEPGGCRGSTGNHWHVEL